MTWRSADSCITSSLLPWCKYKGVKSSYRAWGQSALPAEPPHGLHLPQTPCTDINGGRYFSQTSQKQLKQEHVHLAPWQQDPEGAGCTVHCGPLGGRESWMFLCRCLFLSPLAKCLVPGLPWHCLRWSLLLIQTLWETERCLPMLLVKVHTKTLSLISQI